MAWLLRVRKQQAALPSEKSLDSATASALERLICPCRVGDIAQSNADKLGYSVDGPNWSALESNLSEFSGNCQWIHLQGKDASSRFQVAVGKVLADKVGASLLVVDSVAVEILVATSRDHTASAWRKKSCNHGLSPREDGFRPPPSWGESVDTGSSSLQPTRSLLDYKSSILSASSQTESTVSSSALSAASGSSSPESGSFHCKFGSYVSSIDFLHDTQHVAWLPRQRRKPEPRELMIAARAVWNYCAKKRSSGPVLLLLPNIDELMKDHEIFMKELWSLTSGGVMNSARGLARSTIHALSLCPIFQHLTGFLSRKLGGPSTSWILSWFRYPLFVVATSKNCQSSKTFLDDPRSAAECLNQFLENRQKLWPILPHSFLTMINAGFLWGLPYFLRGMEAITSLCFVTGWWWKAAYILEIMGRKPEHPFNIKLRVQPYQRSSRHHCEHKIFAASQDPLQCSALENISSEEWLKEQEDDMWMDVACAVTGYLRELSQTLPDQLSEEPRWTLFPAREVSWSISWAVGYQHARGPCSFTDEKPSITAVSRSLLADMESLSYGLRMTLKAKSCPPANFYMSHIYHQQYHDAQATAEILGNTVHQLLTMSHGVFPFWRVPQYDHPSFSMPLQDVNIPPKDRAAALLPTGASVEDCPSDPSTLSPYRGSAPSDLAVVRSSVAELEHENDETSLAGLRTVEFSAKKQEYMSKIKELEESVKDLKGRLSAETRARNDAVACMQLEQNQSAEARQRIADLASKLRLKQDELSTTAAALEHHKSAHMQVQSELQVAQKEIQETVLTTGNLQADQERTQLQLVETQKQLVTRTGELQAALSAIEQRVAELQKEKEQAKAKVMTAHAELAKTQLGYDFLQSELAGKEATLQEERMQLQSDHDRKLALLRQMEDDLHTKAADLHAVEAASQQKIAGLKVKLEEAEAEVTRIQGKLADTTTQLQHLRKEVDDKEATCQLERRQHDVTMAHVNAQVAQLEEVKQKAVLACQTAQAQRTGLETQLRELRAEHEKSLAELEVLRTSLRSAEGSMSDSKNLNQRLRQTQEAQEALIAQQRRELKKLRKKVANLSLFGPLGFPCSVVLVVKLCQLLSSQYESSTLLAHGATVRAATWAQLPVNQLPRTNNSLLDIHSGPPVRLMSFASFSDTRAKGGSGMESVPGGLARSSRAVHCQGSLKMTAYKISPLGLGGSGLQQRRPLLRLQEQELRTLP